MKLYKFTADQLIVAENEQEAKDIFANESWDFAVQAEVEEITDSKLIRQYY